MDMEGGIEREPKKAEMLVVKDMGKRREYWEAVIQGALMIMGSMAGEGIS